MQLINRILIVVALCVPIGHASARDREIDPRLDKAWSDYAKYSAIKFESLGRGIEDIKLALADLTEIGVSPCELASQLSAKKPHDPKRIEYVLRDLIDEKTRQIKLSQELILKRLASQRKLDDADRAAVERFARQVASQSNSITELRESIIPKIFDGIGVKLQRIEKIEDKVDLLDLQLRKRIDSICDRLARLEAAIETPLGAEKAYAARRPPIQASNSATTGPVRGRQEGIRWHSVNGTSWEPQAFVSSEQLCSTPKVGPKNVFFDRGVHTKRGIVWVRSYGNIWKDCSGQIVMVTQPLRIAE